MSRGAANLAELMGHERDVLPWPVRGVARDGVGGVACTDLPSGRESSDLPFCSGAGDGNRTRTISLGS
jgi:hypothetical protein